MGKNANAYSLLRSNAPLRRLLTAQAFSDFADWLYYVAVATVLAYVLEVPTFVFALWAVALGAPYVLAGPLAGTVVDRMNIRSVLILSNLGRAVSVAAMILADDWPLLLILVFVSGVVDSFFTPAKQAALQRFTEPDERMRANGMSYAISQSSKIAAPAIGGLILAFSAPATVFATNAVVSLLAASFCLRLPTIPRDTSALPEKSWHSIKAGIGLVRVNKPLRNAVLLAGLGMFAIFLFDTFIPALTRELGFRPSDFGLSMSAVGAGGVLGAVVLGMRESTRNPFGMIALASACAAFVVVGLGLAEIRQITPHLWLYLIAFFLLGIVNAMSIVPTRTIIQNETPQNRIALVTSLSEALNTTAMLIAPFIGAAIAGFGSLGMAFVAGGFFMLVKAIWARTAGATYKN